MSESCGTEDEEEGDPVLLSGVVLTARKKEKHVIGSEIALENPENATKDLWYADTGANVTVINDTKWFESFKNYSGTINTEDATKNLQITATGTVILPIETTETVRKWKLENVLYSPEARCNLLSINQLTSNHPVTATFQGRTGRITDSQNNVLMQIKVRDGLYELELHQPTPSEQVSNQIPQRQAFLLELNDPVWKWHRALGHMSIQNMKLLAERSEGFPLTSKQISKKLGQVCPTCATTRALVKIPRDAHNNKTEEKGQLIHVDTWGPYPLEGYDGSKYFIFITDDFTRKSWGRPFKNKTEIPELFRSMIRELETTENCTVRRIRVDNEFKNNGLIISWCEKHGKRLEAIVPHNHWSNGGAERVNRTLREKAAAVMRDYYLGGQILEIIDAKTKEMLRDCKIPANLWPEAVKYAIWVKNRTPTRTLRKKITPWQAASGDKPNLSKERIFGSRAWVVIPQESRQTGKLMQDRARLGYYVGRESEHIARVYFPDKHTVETASILHIENGTGLDDPQDSPSHSDEFPDDEHYMVEDGTDEDETGEEASEHESVEQEETTNRRDASSTPEGGYTTSRFFAHMTAKETDDTVHEHQDEEELVQQLPNRTKWSIQEIELLHQLTERGDSLEDMHRHLPHRTIYAIQKKKRRLSEIEEITEAKTKKWSGRGRIPTERCHKCARGRHSLYR